MQKVKNDIRKTIIKSDGLEFKILEGGDIESIDYKYNQISMYKGTNLDGTLANIYLRVENDGIIEYTKLIGVDSPSKFYCQDNQVYYDGEFANIKYQVILTIIKHTWFWTIKLAGTGQATLFYGQDVSLNGPFANEAYVCQYLDHQVEYSNDSYHLITKQNQGCPFRLRTGCLNKTIAYATDGFDFFGKDYKFTNIPSALVANQLPSKIYQYELAYHVLQTAELQLDEQPIITFYENFVEDYNQSEQILSLSEIQESAKHLNILPIDQDKLTKLNLKIDYQNTYEFSPLSSKTLKLFKNKMLHKEVIDKEIVSWFDEEGKHYVNGLKEHYLERPHGMIQITNGFKQIDDQTLTMTNWIFGIFNSHIAYGNTNFNKMLTHNRTPLNLLKTSGERLFIKLDGEYQLLAMPSLYVMGVNSSTWYYQIKNDLLKITTCIAYDKPYIITKISSENNKKYDFILTDNLMMGPEEGLQPIMSQMVENKIIFNFAAGTLPAERYADYQFSFETRTNGSFKYGSDEIFYVDKKSRGYPLLSVTYKKASTIEIVHTCLNEISYDDITQLETEYSNKFNENIGNFKLETTSKTDVMKFNHLIKWYTHNALIHYASPHGLEQYGGAAWGTRDVCQGPVELFGALKRYDIVRDIIKRIYSCQFFENGDWPQWFMFDKYRDIQADDSHGDIIVWPLRTIAYYIEQTNDRSILDEVVPYVLKDSKVPTEPAPIIEHIHKEVQSIVNSFVDNTFLPSYGGGDWDDTLQPCNRELTKKMVSGWTVFLLIEALEKFNEVSNNEFAKLVKKIKADYRKYLYVDDVPAGFVYFGDEPKLMLHPKDHTTGIKYRLLPFNRGIISEQISKGKINKCLKIIDENLMHPDGVRLMNTTVHYQGGVPKIFLRAETATNFGREIGLQYVHAHIRYLEAMAKIGNPKRLYKALNVVCPINIKKHVANAAPRQANVYFSSSDGDYRTRYQADEEFDLLRTGQRIVKGGWRLYSSGPGIYLNQFITNFLGIKMHLGQLYLDPVLPPELKGLKVSFNYQGKVLHLNYLQTKTVQKVQVNGYEITDRNLKNVYRPAGIIIDEKLLKDDNEIVIS